MLAMALAILAAQPGNASCHTADSRVESLISGKAAELQGQEYCQFRLYHTIDDVDADGRDDFLVIFAVEVFRGRREWPRPIPRRSFIDEQLEPDATQGRASEESGTSPT